MTRGSDSWIGLLVFIVPCILLFIYFYIRDSIKNELQKHYEYEFNVKKRELENELKEQISNFEEEYTIKTKILEENAKDFPWLAAYYSKFALLKANAIEEYLRFKKNPAMHSAQLVNELKNDICKLSQRVIQLEGISLRIEKEKEKVARDKKISEKIFEEKTIGFPWVAEYYSQYLEDLGNIESEILLAKKIHLARELKK